MGATRSTAIGPSVKMPVLRGGSLLITVSLCDSMDSFLSGSDRCASPDLTSSSAVGPVTGYVRSGLRPSVIELISGCE
jgi:hypothetical protein